MIITIERYLRELEADGKSEKTIIAYHTVLKQFVKWFDESIGDSEIHKVTPTDIKEYKKGYLIEKLERKPATVNKALIVFKSFFEWAIDAGIINTNPAKRIKLVEKQKLAPKWLERTEQNRLLRTIEMERKDFKKTRDKALVQIMMQAGLRVEEVSNLELDDIVINSRSGSVTVRQGKRDKYREVPLNKDAREAIKDYLVERERHKFKDSEFLFVSERNTKMTTRAIQHLVEEYREKARIDGLSCHKLRHTMCHNLVAVGVGIEKVAMLAGHSSLESSRIYTVPGVRELQTAVEKISLDE